MKKFIALFVLIFATSSLFSQTFEVPKDYTFEKPEDYKAFEKDILGCIEWLTSTPANEQFQKRMEANTFLLRWIVGSPNVSIELRPEIVTFLESSPELLMIYMGGFAKYHLATKDKKTNSGANLAAIETVINYYKKNKEHIGPDPNIEKYIEIQKQGNLKKHIESNL